MRRLSSVFRRLIMVGLGRFELPTSRLSSARSNQLSYKPGFGGRTTEEESSAFSILCRLSSDVQTCSFAKKEKRRRRVLQSRMTEDARQTTDIARRTPCFRRCVPKPDEKIESAADFRRPSSVYCHPILRKEVIQPQVPLRLPCYDFTPVAEPTVAGCPLAVGAPS